MTELAKKICLLRSQARMTQLALAEKLDVSRQTVSKWELGTAQPELDKLVALSELFHVSTDYLLKPPATAEPETSLDRLVLRFLGCAKDIDVISSDLVNIMRDGVIDQDEEIRMNDIVSQLNAVSAMIEELRHRLLKHES